MYASTCLRPRVLRASTTSPAIARTFNPLILAIPALSWVVAVVETTTQIIQQNKIVRIVFLLTTFFVGFLAHPPTIICALSASCALRTRVLGLESTDRACTCTRTLRFRRSATAPSPSVPPSHSPCRSYRKCPSVPSILWRDSVSQSHRFVLVSSHRRVSSHHASVCPCAFSSHRTSTTLICAPVPSHSTSSGLWLLTTYL